ncbi:unnamed protein product, partial [Symbiodinium sp. CCMP2456]
ARPCPWPWTCARPIHGIGQRLGRGPACGRDHAHGQGRVRDRVHGRDLEQDQGLGPVLDRGLVHDRGPDRALVQGRERGHDQAPVRGRGPD